MVWGRSKDNYPSDWNSRRKQVLKRDGYTCQECGRSKAELHVHHKTPISEGGSHKFSNLKTVCKSCHEDIHGHGVGGGSAGRRSRNSSEGAWKKLVWTPALFNNTSTTIEGNREVESSFGGDPRSQGEEDALLIAGILFCLTFISPSILAVIDTGMIFTDPFFAILMIPILVILCILLPFLLIPLAILSALVAIPAFYLSRYYLEWQYGELADVYEDTYFEVVFTNEQEDVRNERPINNITSHHDRDDSYIASRRGDKEDK